MIYSGRIVPKRATRWINGFHGRQTQIQSGFQNSIFLHNFMSMLKPVLLDALAKAFEDEMEMELDTVFQKQQNTWSTTSQGLVL